MNLLGYIVSKYKTQKEFAKKMGISNTSLHYRLKGVRSFTQDDIIKCIDLLELTQEEVIELFFPQKVQETKQIS